MKLTTFTGTRSRPASIFYIQNCQRFYRCYRFQKGLSGNFIRLGRQDGDRSIVFFSGRVRPAGVLRFEFQHAWAGEINLAPLET